MTLRKYVIPNGKQVVNMDETCVSVGCPNGEHVLRAIQVKELYNYSPDNRKPISITETVYANGRETSLYHSTRVKVYE